MLQAEIDSVMHGAPVLGSSGDPSLDLYISSAEHTYQGVQEEIRQRLPLFKKRPSDQIGQLDLQGVLKECLGFINLGKAQTDRFMAAAVAHITGKRQQAEGAFKVVTSRMRPESLSDEALALKIHSLELLFNSISPSKLISRIETEISNGDQLTKFILRDGASGWIKYYLQSRGIDMQEYYAMIGRTAGIIETDLQKACEDLARLPAREEQVAGSQQSLNKLWTNLTSEVVNALPSQKMAANSFDDLPDDKPLTVGDIRRMNASRTGGGFFNQHL